MTTIQHFIPRSFFPSVRDFDTLLNEGLGEGHRQFSIKARAEEFDDRYLLQFDVPGIPQDSIDIEFNNGVLKVKGERKTVEESDSGKTHFSEIRYGSFVRSFKLPDTVGTEDIEAKYDSGVLTIILPKKPEAAPKKISIVPPIK